ncbi:MAG: spore coat U domain-containing protein [Roseiarcus sp.]|jgi:spore coat protein U-like protein
MFSKRLLLAAVAASSCLFPALANASTAVGNLAVTMTIASTCTVSTSGVLAFGSVGLLTTAVSATGSFGVTCTNTTPYNVGLNQGANGGTVTTRQMKGSTTAALVNYSIFSNVAATTNWGNTTGSWVAGVGTGSSQTMNVYGVVPVQATPAPDTYTDTVTITINY